MICFMIFYSVSLPLLCNAIQSYPIQGTFLETPLTEGEGNQSYILPTNCKPKWYNLNLWPFLENATFKGKVDILFEVVHSTDTIVLNLNPDTINVSSMVVKVISNETDVSVVNTTIAVPQSMISFKLNATLVVGRLYNISISYEGILGKEMNGFYISSYNTTSTSSSGTTITEHRMAVTQFESTYARKAFPCFDEPAYRARFNISIMRPSNLTSISNMPLAWSIYYADSNQTLDVYEPTPLMPTYLVAFGVSDLANITNNGTVRVFARKEVLLEGNYALSVAPRILEEINDVVDVKYPLKKIDIAAIPDFAAGAMENWGLTTYREKYVLYNPAKNTFLDKFSILSVVAHEFGHQWFGDLATPQWWNYTWLNEAFATYMEYTIPEQVERQWLTGFGQEAFVMMAVQDALARDTGTPRPMTAQVYSPSEIENIFDYVIYQKGGSILRMAESFLTTAVWRSGLHKYLTDNSYGTGTPEKLFSALQNAADSAGIVVNVNETLHGWTRQGGYPVINIARTLVNATGNTTTFIITQEPYDLTNSSQLGWNVPLTYLTSGQTVPTFHWLLPFSPSTSVLVANTTGWVLFNVNQTAFCRINYDDSMWKELAALLSKNHSVIGSINRGQLIDDAFHLARTAHISYATAFSLLTYIPHEQSVVPWNAFFKNMRYLMNQFSSTTTGDGLKQYSQGVIAGPFQALTANLSQFPTVDISLVTQYAVEFSCEVELPQCVNMAYNMFQMWRDNKTSWILPEIKQTVLCTGLKKSPTHSNFLVLLTSYLKSDNANEKLTILSALGCLTDEGVIYEFLDIVCDVNSNYIRLQDRWIAFRSLAKGQASVMPTLRYLAKNYNKTTNAVGSRIHVVYSTIGQTLSQTSHIEEVKRMVNGGQLDPRLRDSLNSTVLSAVNKRLAWASSPQAESLKAWVASQPSSAPSTVLSPILLITIITLYTTAIRQV